MLIRKHFPKRAQSDELRFLFGIILAGAVIFFFARCTINFVKEADTSLGRFNALVAKISELQGGAGAEQLTYQQIITLKETEIIMFFDKGVNFIAGTYADIDADDFNEANYDIFGVEGDKGMDVENLRQEVTAIFLYERPKQQCGEDSACIVLCRKPMVTPKSSFEFQFSKDEKRITLNRKVGLIQCESVEARTLTNVNHFYRKPVYSRESMCRAKSLPVKISSAIVVGSCTRTMTFSHGFVLQTHLFTLYLVSDPGYLDVDKKVSPFISGSSHVVKTYWIYSYPLILWEFKEDNSKTGEDETGHKVLSTDYVTLQSYKDTVIACYQSPCLTPSEEFHLLWANNILGPCLSSSNSNCAALSEKISTIRKLDYAQKMTFAKALVLPENAVTKFLSIANKPLFKLTIETTPKGAEQSTTKNYWFSSESDFDMQISYHDTQANKEVVQTVNDIFFFKGISLDDKYSFVVTKVGNDYRIFGSATFTPADKDKTTKAVLVFHLGDVIQIKQ